MPNLITAPIFEKSPYMMGLLELDADPAAERFAVIDRASLKLLWQKEVPAGGQVKCLVRPSYALSGVLVMILDDNQEYNAKVADGVTLPLVDSHTVNLGY
ncbi:hypothetical protein Sden_3239 [Shewanella denitrificans OS217]|uniref:Uncharacterized protein n=1 Tax=Shewanella denitrificans (strain OS217 / ATCC BAA-1090 / DSM 15013) TaxID=318161 RepID=Q12J61_SHEDO|nr:hypothetical protein [Shewanella denitrificans]ABE56515.1 hypothetical protein Sden_3239 [Shewanella denitrificans OS217]